MKTELIHRDCKCNNRRLVVACTFWLDPLTVGTAGQFGPKKGDIEWVHYNEYLEYNRGDIEWGTLGTLYTI